MAKDAFGKGLDYLSQGRSDLAEASFREGIERHASGTHLYLYLGASRWLTGNYFGAVESWLAGMRCPDIDGGLTFANLLWFAAAAETKSYPLVEATRDIRAASKRAAPNVTEHVPIGQYLAHSSDDGNARSKIAKRKSDIASYRIEFYIGAKHLAQGDTPGYLERMLFCATVDNPRICKLAESFLAKYESTRERPRRIATAVKAAKKHIRSRVFPLQRGEFYSNLVVYGAPPESVIGRLQTARRRAIILPGESERTIIFDRECEKDQKDRRAVPLRLSKDLQCTVLSLSVHDDDLLEYDLYAKGKHQGSYSSRPDYFGDDSNADGPRESAQISAEKLAKFFRLQGRIELKLARVLKQNCASESTRYEKLAAILGIPVDSIGLTYQSIDAASPFPKGFRRVASLEKGK